MLVSSPHPVLRMLMISLGGLWQCWRSRSARSSLVRLLSRPHAVACSSDLFVPQAGILVDFLITMLMLPEMASSRIIPAYSVHAAALVLD